MYKYIHPQEYNIQSKTEGINYYLLNQFFTVRYNKSMNEHNISKNGFLLLSKYRTAIMGFAALWILFFHVWQPLIPVSSNRFLNLFVLLEHFSTNFGYSGVDIFFLLSGAGLTYAIKKESIPVFYARRLLKVLPPFLLLAVLRSVFQNWTILDFVCNVSGYSFYAVHIFTFLWFVTAIITLYFFFPLYNRIFSKAKNKLIFTCCVILVWMLISFLVRNIMRSDLFAFTNRIPIFVVGIYVGYVSQNFKEIVFKKWVYLLLLIVLSLGLYLAYLYNYTSFHIFVTQGNTFLPPFLIAISLPFLLAKLLDILENRISTLGKIINVTLSFFGAMSLELYCFQDWLDMYTPYLQYYGVPKTVINFSLILISIAAAWASAKLIKLFSQEIPDRIKNKNMKEKAT